jgi:hypothetical protein
MVVSSIVGFHSSYGKPQRESGYSDHVEAKTLTDPRFFTISGPRKCKNRGWLRFWTASHRLVAEMRDIDQLAPLHVRGCSRHLTSGQPGSHSREQLDLHFGASGQSLLVAGDFDITIRTAQLRYKAGFPTDWDCGEFPVDSTEAHGDKFGSTMV